MGGEWMERLPRRFRPPREMTFREPLEAQPEALSIIDEELQSSAASVAKQKDSAGERVTTKVVATQRGKGINALAEVNRLICEHDGELWRELDHVLGAHECCAQGFELSRGNSAQMQCQARAVGTLEEHAGGSVYRRGVAWRQISSAQL
jgi:hypothetical protein